MVDVRRLDRFGPFEGLSVIKVDIEGHEAAFLEGARKTIERYRPVIFCEVLSVAECDRLERFRRSIDYADIRLRPDAAIIAPRVAFDEAAWNHVLLPRERAADFMAVWDRITAG
jgi:hypothetical protein